MKNTTFIFSLLLLLPSLFIGQNSDTVISRSVLSPLGNFNAVGGIEMSYTVGQLVISTEIDIRGKVVLRQGFQQQTDSLNVSVEKPRKTELSYRIFPNPTKERLFVELEAEKPVQLSLVIFDMAGKATRIPPREIRLMGQKRLSFDLEGLPAAFYTLKMMDRDNREIKTFKIQKIH